MGKVCLACGIAPLEPKKLPHEPEDCPGCGGKETVRHMPPKEGEKEEGKNP